MTSAHEHGPETATTSAHEHGPEMVMTSAPAAGPGAAPEHDSGMAMGLATPWAHFFAAIVLGFWLLTGPTSFSYHDTGLAVSDVVSGALIVGFAIVTLWRRSSWAPWASTLVGLWLLLAPLVFKAPTAEAFANDWLSGILVIAFVLLMPGMPGMRMLPGPDVPTGWSYNPSAWSQRAPIIALAVVNFLLSRYMTTYELHYVKSIWDPFFDPGTSAVLTSKVSHSFPVSDAGLGAISYILEGLMGFMGDRRRWRTMPWMVWIFGILVVPLGIVSIALIMLQPVAVGAWCTPCLIAALTMLVMIALTLDEVVATTIFVVRAHREGQSAWHVFWLGGALGDTNADEDNRTHPDVISPRAMIWGTGVPWNLLVTAALGIWLMASPAVLSITSGAADASEIIGALVVSVALISLSEVGRAVRFVNVLFGGWFIVMPFVLTGSTPASKASDIVIGLALIALSVRRGKIRENYGSWNRYVI